MPIVAAIGKGLAALGGGSAAVGAAIAGGVAATGATIYSANKASGDSKKATAAALAANEANARLAQQIYDQNAALYAPELNRGRQADSVLDELYGLGGVFRTSGAGAAPTYAGAAPTYAGAAPTYAGGYGGLYGGGGIDYARIANERPDVAREAARIGIPLQQYVDRYWIGGGVKDDAGDSYEVPYVGASYGAGYDGSEATTQQAPVYNADELRQLYTRGVPYQLGEAEADANNAILNQGYDRDVTTLGMQRGELDDIARGRFDAVGANISAERDAADAEAQRMRDEQDAEARRRRDEQDAEARRRRGETEAQIAAARAEREAQRAQTRAAMRGVADENYGRTVNLLGDDLRTLTGFTDTATADLLRLNNLYQGQARDRIAGMYGVTGQTGKSIRAAQEAADQLNLGLAGTVRDWRNQDYERFRLPRLAADANRGAVYLTSEGDYATRGDNLINIADAGRMDAINRYGAARDDAINRYGAARDAAINRYGDALVGNMGRSFGNQRTNLEGLFSDQGGNAQQDYAGRLIAGQNLTQGQLANTGQRFGSRRNAYGDWEGYIQGQTRRGQLGRDAIAGANVDRGNAVARANTGSARAYGENAMNQSYIRDGAMRSFASIAGDVAGAYNYERDRKKFPWPDL